MAVYSGVKIEGGRQLRKSLRQAGADMTQLRETNQKVADIALQQALIWCPKDTRKLENTLRTQASQTRARLAAGNNRTTKNAVRYANPIHWGWKARGIKANPFLSYSAQATEPEWFEVYFKALLEIIDSVEGTKRL